MEKLVPEQKYTPKELFCGHSNNEYKFIHLIHSKFPFLLRTEVKKVLCKVCFKYKVYRLTSYKFGNSKNLSNEQRFPKRVLQINIYTI